MPEAYKISKLDTSDSMGGLEQESSINNLGTDSKDGTEVNPADSFEEGIDQTRIVEDERLGVSFEEKIIHLPKHRQEETGIKRIRRRRLIKFPDFFSEDGYKYQGFSDSKEVAKIWDFITDNKISSGTKLGHVVARRFDDMTNEDARVRGLQQIDQHTTEGFYFGKISPDNYYDHEREIIDDVEISDLYTTLGNCIWRQDIKTPVYFFGTENIAFREYLKSIIDNEHVLNCLKMRWRNGFSSHYGLAYPGSNEFEEEYKKDLQKYSDPIYTYDFIPIMHEQKKICEEKNIPIITGGSGGQYSSFLEILSEGIGATEFTPAREILIPSINSKEIKPLRWCHSDLAIIPTKKSLNILFFESV